MAKSRRDRQRAMRAAAKRYRDLTESEEQAHREELDLADDEAVCPDCAEVVLRAARICKHCGYDFERRRSGAKASRGEARATAPRKNPWVAVLLALLVAGAGHVYAGRVAQGVLVFFGVVALSLLVFPLGLVLYVAQIPLAAHAVQAYNMEQWERTFSRRRRRR